MLSTFKRSHLVIAAIILAAGIAVTGWLIFRPTYDDIVNDCIAALKERPKGDKSKPDACKDVKEDDYTALVFSKVIDDLGWTDENGRFDRNKMIEDTLDD